MPILRDSTVRFGRVPLAVGGLLSVMLGCATGSTRAHVQPTALELQQREQQRELERRLSERAAAEDRAVMEARDETARSQARRAEQARDEANQRAARLDAIQKRAAAEGYARVVLEGGLVALLNLAIKEALPIDYLAATAVVLEPNDWGWTTIQVLPDQSALMVSDGSACKIVVSGSGAYEGTRLLSTPLRVVAITGVKTFQAAGGGSLQAFLVSAAGEPRCAGRPSPARHNGSRRCS
jgi:hypothetical protein